jgi:CRP-like cAMP-binding protein
MNVAKQTDIDLLQALQASKLAAELNAEQLTLLAPLLQLQDCAAGYVLAREGEADTRMHAVVRGALQVVKDHGTPQAERLLTVNAGELTHELGFLDGAARYASLVADSDSRVLHLERGQLERLADTHPQILYKLMRAIVRAAHGVQARQSQQASELTNYIVKQHGRY